MALICATPVYSIRGGRCVDVPPQNRLPFQARGLGVTNLSSGGWVGG